MVNDGDNNQVLPEGDNDPAVIAARLEALTNKMKENDERLKALEAENTSLRAENTSLRAERGVGRRVNITRMQPLNGTPPPTGNGSELDNHNVHDDTPETNNNNRIQSDDQPLGGQSKEDSHFRSMFSKRIEEMEALIKRLPGVAPPITKSAPNSYADTPFTDKIALVEMPKKFTFPSMKMYDGTTDPDNHIAQYKQRMFTTAIAREYREAGMCKGFGSSLTGPALQWFTNLPNASIDSFASLTDRFVEQFASSRNLERAADDLYEVVQRNGESLRSYVGRFNKERISIPNCNMTTAISAFKRGLVPGDLYKELTKYQCKTMEDVLSRAWAQIKWEEDPTYYYQRSPRCDSRVVRNERSLRDDNPYQRPHDNNNENKNNKQGVHRLFNMDEKEKHPKTP